jgi:hypothetical protein
MARRALARGAAGAGRGGRSPPRSSSRPSPPSSCGPRSPRPSVPPTGRRCASPSSRRLSRPRCRSCSRSRSPAPLPAALPGPHPRSSRSWARPSSCPRSSRSSAFSPSSAGRAPLAGAGPRRSAAVQIYGLHGIVLAHVFFNLPLATRLILQGWLESRPNASASPPRSGSKRRDINRLIERPILRATLPGAFLVIFLVCTTSFAVALALGGGPARHDDRARHLPGLRLRLRPRPRGPPRRAPVRRRGGCRAAAFRLARLAALGGGLDRPVERWDARTPGARALDALLSWLAAAFLLLPLAMIAARGLPALAGLPPVVWQAALRSLAVALVSALLATSRRFAIALASSASPARRRPSSKARATPRSPSRRS